MWNNRMRWRSINVQQHCVDVKEIFIVFVCVLSTPDIGNEIVQRICEIRMQITENINEWLIIQRAAISGSDHHDEKLGH